MASNITLAVLQPGYIPWLGFFDQLIKADVFVYYDDVQFDKHGWRNRNRIKTPNGPQWLTVPVHVNDRPAINQVKIDNTKPWAAKHSKTLTQHYNKARYFDDVLTLLQPLLHMKWERLVDLDLAINAVIARYMAIETPICLASELPIKGDNNSRLLNLCEHFHATRYLSGNAAQNYLDVELFQRHGIDVVWQDYTHPCYTQLYGDFVPYLSVVDLLFNEGPRSRQVLDQAKRG